MKKLTFTTIIIANLLAIGLLMISYPHLMISPGPLMEKHQELTTDCFACHAGFRGSSPEKCMTCHEVSKIGLFTTKGIKIEDQREQVAFHQHLLEEDCVACHSDHRGVQMYRVVIKQFSHELLNSTTQKDCDSCHRNPADALHKHLAVENCGQCHGQTRWQPAKFKHDWVTEAAQKLCEACHDKPEDNLHKRLVGNCGKCHTQTEWEPATFDHNEHFQLDADHDVQCVKCHLNHDYSRYTCYGCHEHRPAKIREEHWEEGIREYEDCTDCHRNANEDDAKRLWRLKRFSLDKTSPFPNQGKHEEEEEEEEEDDD